ncbi:GerAB/ArcD/ProY family transporter [Metabacillus arenae]|uniref:GerAB/ArcD/ProY family transporter n=1 Tax=Metabacillus arenae TaxID=2771434 RepID=A0A926RZ68_9BACI|nr:GerAB/ArcD/ProY family transporter [Metabacillus arenae]MBD1382505.1 GerAB/ArcD/ProY family transporter [Metabacillus arenae]
MKQSKISALQLFYVMIGFEIGNTMIFGRGLKAGQDAWLTTLIGMLFGLILMFVYIKLTEYYPGDTLIQMIPKIIGKFLSFPLILIYICYFTLLASTACRDFGELIASTILVQTPIVIVIGSFMVLMIYCLRGGVEAFGRMGEVVFPIYILSLLVIWILVISSEPFNLKNMTPILGDGIKPVLEEVFPDVITFPFGETIIITMFFPALNKNKYIKLAGLSVILIGGIMLTINAILNIAVLGPEVYSKYQFPLLSATRIVSIADFLERFDVLIILMIVAGVFFKVGGWTYGAVVGISQLFKLKNQRSVFLGIGTIIIPFSLIYASNFVEFTGNLRIFITNYLHVPLQIVIPILLLCIAFIRKKLNSSNSS